MGRRGNAAAITAMSVSAALLLGASAETLAAPKQCLPDELAGAPVAAEPAPAPPRPLQFPIGSETASYEIRHGLLGRVGSLEVEVRPDGKEAAAPLRSRATGLGSLLGFGETERRMESELDPVARIARRWRSERRQGTRVVTDEADQRTPGAVELLRRRTDRPDNHAALASGLPVYDALSLLAALRLAPPRAPTEYRILDGRGLWHVRLAGAVGDRLRAGESSRAALKLTGRAEPIRWDGAPDPERSARAFSLWLADDVHRTPLRFETPVGLGTVEIQLASVRRQMTQPDLERLVRSLLRRHPLLAARARAAGLN